MFVANRYISQGNAQIAMIKLTVCMYIYLIKKEWEAFQSGTWFCWFTRYTLRSLLSILFYQTAWSEFFQKVSIKQPGPSQKKLILLFYFRAATANFWSLLNNLVWIFGEVSYQTTSTIFFLNSRSLERPGLIIETFEYKQAEWTTKFHEQEITGWRKTIYYLNLFFRNGGLIVRRWRKAKTTRTAQFLSKDFKKKGMCKDW